MNMIKHILAYLFFFWGNGTLLAQGGFNPDNPPEPQIEYTVTVTATPSDVANVSGGGKYADGTNVTIKTSARSSNYAFLYWMEDGEVYSTSTSFVYTAKKNAHFVAVYQYNPSNPAEPSLINQYRLYLESDTEGSCSFNRTSGAKVDVGANVNVRAYPNAYYTFHGWYIGDVKVSDSNPFTYKMSDRNVTLTAHFTYDYLFNPVDPSEPSTIQDDVDNSEGILGDANGNGNVDITDVVAVVNYILGVQPMVFIEKNADVDYNKNIDISDVVGIVNIILGK